jgi:hypothetical protein
VFLLHCRKRSVVQAHTLQNVIVWLFLPCMTSWLHAAVTIWIVLRSLAVRGRGSDVVCCASCIVHQHCFSKLTLVHSDCSHAASHTAHCGSIHPRVCTGVFAA